MTADGRGGLRLNRKRTGYMRAILLRAFVGFLSRLPLRAIHALGAAIGWLLMAIPNKRRRVAEVNLALCFPEKDAAARRQLLRGTLIEFGKTLEAAVIWTKDADGIMRLVTEVKGEEEIGDALELGKGAILAMPHLGAWELVNLYCSARYPVTTMYRPPRISGLDRTIRSARQRLGARLVAADVSGIRALYRALARGEMVGILPDQIPRQRHGGVFAEFFGIQANTMVLLSKLAQKTGARVVFAYAERLSRGGGFRLRFEAGPAEIGAGTVESSATLVNREIERQVRRLPMQYQWCYKRFRDRPAGERSLYRRRGAAHKKPAATAL